ncbi:wd40 repeat-containing protein [Leptolyngbya sp. Heron Island J]|uniref:nSTAND1 domain-containing NTPase n=1 Tax=Leptolyngbya sp. Heron Island J TaxID=1385935 RepID=UPI0003B939AF|nr:WD40 repeat domain-containing protein [Leptolyngbya sp. Heron Island J]ESA36639.1 wd40 repeat-containing protein [Leptolyngbya sp. Heron Island J]
MNNELVKKNHNPYRGLAPYSEDDAPFFFGREKLQRNIISSLKSSRLTLLYGSSGVGKSSVLQAGVVYHLRELAKQKLKNHGTPKFVVVMFRSWHSDPTADLISQIEADVTKLYQEAKAEISELLPHSSHLDETLQTWTELIGKKDKNGQLVSRGKFLIILDQFEDYFADNFDESGEDKFAEEFSCAVTRPGLNVNFLISMRDDALSKIDRFQGRIPGLFSNYLRLKHLDIDSAQQAIVKPIKQCSRLQILLNNLQNSRLTLLTGGCVGKSFLLEAGVVHFLRQTLRQHLKDNLRPESAVIFFDSWRDNPLAGLMRQVEIDIQDLLSQQDFQLFPQPMDFVQALHTWTKFIGGKKGEGKLFIILDQFEDYFRYHPNEDGKDDFAVNFLRAVNDVSLSVHFLISIHEDCLTQLNSLLERKVHHWHGDYLRMLDDDLFDNGIRFENLRGEQSEGENHSRQRSLDGELFSIESDLVEEVLSQVSQTPTKRGLSYFDIIGLESFQTGQIEAPYLQLVMTRLWEQEMSLDSHCLRLETLRRLGGTQKIVKDHFDSKINSLSPQEKESAVIIFQELVTQQGSKIAFPIYELLPSLPIGQQQLSSMLEKLAHGYFRILRPVGRIPNQSEAEERFEIFHDVLAPAILSWLRQELYKQELEKQFQEQIELVRWETKLQEQKQLHIRNIKQALPIQALYQQKRRQDELSALIARQAYLFNQRDQCQILNQIDEALGKVLGTDDFSSIFYGHSSPVSTVALSPNGQTAASGSYDGTIKLWDLSMSGSKQILEGHESAVSSLSFSSNGQWLVSGSWDNTIRLWPINQLGTSPQILEAQGERVNSVIFSPDCTNLASGHDDGTVRLWNLNQLKDPPQVFKGHSDKVYAVAFSSNGKWLASGSDDNTMRLWDLQQPKVATHIFEHKQAVYSVAFGPDSQKLASGCGDSIVRLWNLDDQLDTDPHILEGHKGDILSVAFSPDGQKLASGSSDETIRLWNLQHFHAAPKILRGHFIAVNSVAFNPTNSEQLVSGSSDNTIRVWDLQQFSTESTVLKGHFDTVTAVSFNSMSMDEQQLASGSYDHTVRLWNLSMPDIDSQILHRHKGKVMAVAFSPDGRMLASGSEDRTVYLVNLQDPKAVPIVLQGHQDGVSSVAFSPDGKMLASGSWSQDRAVRLWDLQQPNAPLKVLKGHDWSVTSVTFSPDSRFLASGSDDHRIRIWDLQNLDSDPVILQNHSGRVWSVVFSPDNKRLASASDDWDVRLWNLETIDQGYVSQSPKVLKGHRAWVGAVVFSPDGKTLASGSYDRSIRLWNLNHPDDPPVVLEGHERSVTSVAFGPDGKTLASGSDDNTIRIWNTSTRELADMVCKKVLRNLTMKEWQEFMGNDIPYERTCPNLPSGEGAPVEAPAYVEQNDGTFKTQIFRQDSP